MWEDLLVAKTIAYCLLWTPPQVTTGSPTNSQQTPFLLWLTLHILLVILCDVVVQHYALSWLAQYAMARDNMIYPFDGLGVSFLAPSRGHDLTGLPQ